MINVDEVKNYYNNKLEQGTQELKHIKSKIAYIGICRLLLIFIIILPWIFWGLDSIIFQITLVVGIVLFLVLVKRHDYFFRKKKYKEKKIANFQNELLGLQYDFSHFDGGKEYIDSSHFYSFDLDLFGNISLFQVLNRTVNLKGKNNLKDRMLDPSHNIESILETQKTLKELSQNPDLLFHFTTTGQSIENDLDISDFSDKFSKGTLLSKSFWKYAYFFPPAILALVFISYHQSIIPLSLVVLIYSFLIFFSLIPFANIKRKMTNFDKKLTGLQNYTSLLQIIEQESFNSKELKELQERLQQNNRRASESIKELEQISNNLLQSQTILGIFILNPIVLWNVIYTIKLENWFRKNDSYISQWLNVLADFDSLISLGIFTFNHPAYSFPHLSDKQLCLEGKAIGHPLMNPDHCITNDINICDNPQFLIVTGANMAGKSTYLRTVSINLILAEMGAPVFADEFTCYPFKLITNLRTSDSLTDNESYFFAELKKLKLIIEQLEAGQKLFIVLDEILKGTNSEDKQKGSIALMKQLIKNNGHGIIATHDLVLGNLEKEYPGLIKNFRFEAEIIDDELYFSYKQKEGIAQNMNACFLMKKMGIAGL